MISCCCGAGGTACIYVYTCMQLPVKTLLLKWMMSCVRMCVHVTSYVGMYIYVYVYAYMHVCIHMDVYISLLELP